MRAILVGLFLGAFAFAFADAFILPEARSFGTVGRNDTFNYVVIGGGTAGLVLAARLAQNGHSVAIVESGGFYQLDAGNISVIPSNAVRYAGADPRDTNPDIDWGFVTSPQAGMNNRRLHYARGKCLGGSSGRNYFTYMRGTRQSYARWASEVGDDSYTFDSFVPYMQKAVHFTPPDNNQRAHNASVPYDPAAFGTTTGPVQVSIPPWANPFSSFVKKAWEQLGIAAAMDFVSGTLAGVQYNMNTIDPRDQSRSSSQTAFLQMAFEHETGSRLYNHTMAKRILFDGTTASGVLVNTDGVEYTLSAQNEVILSAGAFQSPQLLMVSGVGPTEILYQQNIPVVSALNGVGQNMWDHLLFGMSYQVVPVTHSALGNASVLAEATKAYHLNQTGLLTNPGGDLIAWEKLPSPQRDALSPATQAALAEFPPDWPEIEYLTLDAYSGNNENYQTGAPKTFFMYASPSAALVAPLSRGNITISSRDMADPPVINPNWLSHPADQELAVAAFRRVRQMMDTEVMKGIIVGEEVYPGRNVSSDAQILDAIRDNGIMTFHASCTCKMGRLDDPMAVVDSQGRVFGTQRLRVVDSSALPFLPPGHPQATIYGLAEKIAADILRQTETAIDRS